MTGSALGAERCVMAILQGGELERGSDPIASDRTPLEKVLDDGKRLGR